MFSKSKFLCVVWLVLNIRHTWMVKEQNVWGTSSCKFADLLYVYVKYVYRGTSMSYSEPGFLYWPRLYGFSLIKWRLPGPNHKYFLFLGLDCAKNSATNISCLGPLKYVEVPYRNSTSCSNSSLVECTPATQATLYRVALVGNGDDHVQVSP